MSYKSKRIAQVIAEIDQSKIYLPALQRKFVWGKHQIQLLFDSLMRNYPIGTFLFWGLHKSTADNYVFYEFLKEYDERRPYNRRKTGAFLHEEITGVLDGQQRLSSIYIGLMGTHTERAQYQRVNNPNAYKKMCLYLNLLSLPYIVQEQTNRIEEQEDRNFEFRFLEPDMAAKTTSRMVTVEQEEGPSQPQREPVYWFKVGDVLKWDQDPEFGTIIEHMAEKCTDSVQSQAIHSKRRLIQKCLEILHRRLCRDELINYFEIEKEDLEDILKIFIRVNSGGTFLSKTDLLFSTIVATWDDGREQIESLLQFINNRGNGFTFGNEYLMRCCLVLSDAQVVFKVNSFKAENVQRIQTEWPKIAEAVKKTVDLLVEFGFSGSLLPSQNATIIIAYHIYKGGDLGAASKAAIRKYLIHALLNRLYSSSQDQLINALRNALREEQLSESGVKSYRLKRPVFPFTDLLKVPLPGRKSLAVTEEDIELFLSTKKGPMSFLVLSLLYPQLRYEDHSFHQDHIHPYAHFNKTHLTAQGVDPNAQADWYDCRDAVPNLQLLHGPENSAKNATPLQEWIARMDPAMRSTFMQENYFPPGVSLEFADFQTFFQARKEILRARLKAVLAFSSEKRDPAPEEWEIEGEIELEQRAEPFGAAL